MTFITANEDHWCIDTTQLNAGSMVFIRARSGSLNSRCQLLGGSEGPDDMHPGLFRQHCMSNEFNLMLVLPEGLDNRPYCLAVRRPLHRHDDPVSDWERVPTERVTLWAWVLHGRHGDEIPVQQVHQPVKCETTSLPNERPRRRLTL